jgi:hypothetical protein
MAYLSSESLLGRGIYVRFLPCVGRSASNQTVPADDIGDSANIRERAHHCTVSAGDPRTYPRLAHT